jgi:hypothetical protein
METRIGKISNGKPELKLTNSGFWAFVPKAMTTAKFYSVNNVTISTHRNFVEHTMPGRKGSVFQDMGRPAIKIVIEGNLNEGRVLTGLSTARGNVADEKQFMLHNLHKLCESGEPVDFICDMPTLFGVNKVVIQDLEATEAKGRRYDYDYKLTLKEVQDEDGGKHMDKYRKSRQTFALKKMGKKLLIVGAAAAGVGVLSASYAAAKGIDEASKGGPSTMVVSLRLDRARVKVNEPVQVNVVVSSTKGEKLSGAKVDVKSTVGTGGAEEDVKSGLSTDSNGLAVATFKSATQGTHTIKATVTMDGYQDNSQTSTVRVGESMVVSIQSARQAGQQLKVDVKVTVSDTGGAKLGDATVKVQYKASTSASYEDVGTATTNTDGLATITFTAPSAGEYTLMATVTKDGYDGSSQTGKVTV